jgi:oligopeptide transport system ATP-binding protein
VGEPLLAVHDLRVSFAARQAAEATPLRGIELAVQQGQMHALVGESGSGKTLTATCVMGLLPTPPARIDGGSIRFQGRELLGLPEAERRRLRGRSMGMIFQEPSKYLNPSLRVSEQIVEALVLHLGMSRPAALARAGELLEMVGLAGAGGVLRKYPHELSGGMRQRVMIAMAISCNPSLVIADEPTTALDVTLQRQILRLLLELQERLSVAVLFVSHDLAVVHDICERVSVIYAGRIVESGSRDAVFDRPLHPYTRALLASIPEASKRGTRLQAIPGTVPDASHVPPGCAFHPRCPLAAPECRTRLPELREYGLAAHGPAPETEPGAQYGSSAGCQPEQSHTAACLRIGK